MKKVIIISSSMRKGNSDTLCDEFQKGAEKNNETVRINLRDINLQFCKACSDCYEIGRCTHLDDMNKIYASIKDADVLAFATPIYFGEISGQLKTFIDRLYPIYKSLKAKEIVVIATCYSNNKKFIDDSINSIKRFAADIGDIPITHIIYGENCDESNDVSSLQKKKAYEIGLLIK